jgi:hypothetical protein
MFLRKYSMPITIFCLILLLSLGFLFVPGSGVKVPKVPNFSNLEGASAKALSSSWYCIDFNGVYGSVVQTDLLMTSVSDHTISGNYDLYLTSGKTDTINFEVNPKSFNVVNVNSLTSTPVVAVGVNVNGGGVGVEMELISANEDKFVNCSPSLNSIQISGGGSTYLNSNYQLALLNPTSVSTVVDVSIFTTLGEQIPQQLQGLVVNQNSIVVENLTTEIPNSNIEYVEVSVASGGSTIVSSAISYGDNYLLFEPSLAQHSTITEFGPNINDGTQTLTFVNSSQNVTNVVVQPFLSNLKVGEITESIPPLSVLNVPVSDLTSIPNGQTYSLRIISKPTLLVWMYNSQFTMLEFGYPILTSTFSLPILSTSQLNTNLAISSSSGRIGSFKIQALFPRQNSLISSELKGINYDIYLSPSLSQLFATSNLNINTSNSLPFALNLKFADGEVPELISLNSTMIPILPVQISTG